MSGKKNIILRGHVYSKIKVNCRSNIGRGGNGEVYPATILDDNDLGMEIVVKFFRCKNDPIRYERFKRETLFIVKSSDYFNGILPIYDYSLPDYSELDEKEAWYIMPKAEKFYVTQKRSLLENLRIMKELAIIIRDLHEKNYAHRDIKPDNILFYKGKVYLADFGLLWNVNYKQFTQINERLGPYKIMPPELEEVHPNSNIEYTKSDVYLWAKVLWMILKRNNIGFRGTYSRGDSQIYLQKDGEYSDVITFEPIHKIMENATCQDMNKRLDISHCIDLLDCQIRILDQEEERIDEQLLAKLIYEEDAKEITSQMCPDSEVYQGQEKIIGVLKAVFRDAIFYIKDNRISQDDMIGYEKLPFRFLSINDDSDGRVSLSTFVQGKGTTVYSFYIKELKYFRENELIQLSLAEKNQTMMGFQKFNMNLSMFGQVFLDDDYTIMLAKPGYEINEWRL